jgi:hypothetical protein
VELTQCAAHRAGIILHPSRWPARASALLI